MTSNTDAYDYIIVGAGSAGCVLANRLTEDGTSTVLLLEAGPRDTDPWIHIPLGYGKLFTNTRYNWCYQTEPQAECHGRNVIAPRAWCSAFLKYGSSSRCDQPGTSQAS